MADPSGPKRQRFPRSARIKSRRVFERAFSERCRAIDRHMVVFAVPNDAGTVRLGISVGKAYGSAVQRNRIKRLLREAFRQVRHKLPTGIDLVIVPRKQDSEPTIDNLQMSISRLCHQLQERLE